MDVTPNPINPINPKLISLPAKQVIELVHAGEGDPAEVRELNEAPGSVFEGLFFFLGGGGGWGVRV